MFNNISRVEFFDIIATSFPELLPLTKLFYSNPGNVFHKWVDGEWKILHMEEGSSQGCPLSPILAALVVVRLLKPIDHSLRQRALQRFEAGILHDDNYGGRTHLLGFLDDISTLVPLEDLLFLCDQFKQRGIPLGCFINKGKTRILTSTNGISPIQAISISNPSLAQDITSAISRYSTTPNKHDPSQHDPIELTDGFRLLGLPVGNREFTISFLNEQLEAIQKQSTTVHKVIQDPHTRLRLFQQCTSMKLSHLLVTDALHNLPAENLHR